MLTEYTTPGPALTVRNDETIYSLLTDRIARSGEGSPLTENKEADGTWSKLTAGQFNDRVRAIAKGLIAFGIKKGDAVTIFSATRVEWGLLDFALAAVGAVTVPIRVRAIAKGLIAFGIKKGDAVTIFSATRVEWGLLDFALAAVGAVTVPIYDTDSAAQAERILNDSNVKLAIADNQERFDRLDSVLDHCPSLERILMLDANAVEALEGLGVMVSSEELDERIASVNADDLATIVYTSGSTGTPKGAELSHRNFVSITRAAADCVPEVLEGNSRLLLFLPLAHCFARFIQDFAFTSDAGVIGYLPSTKTLPHDMQVFEPTFVLAVPRVFEKVYNAASRKAGTGWKGRLFAKSVEFAREWTEMEQAGIAPTPKQKAELPHDMQVFEPTFVLAVPRVFEKVYNAASRKAGTGWKGRLFAKSVEFAREWTEMEQAGIAPTPKQKAEHAMYEKLVYSTIRSAFGPRIKYLACGGAARRSTANSPRSSTASV